MGKPRRAPSGVGAYGTLEEDGPGTWEALLPPCRRGTGKATGQGRPEPRPTGGEGVGGLQTSEDVGARVGPRTRPSKGGPCWCERSKGPMTGAWTSGLMSPEIRKVVDRAMSHISGRAGWWKPPSPVLVRASGEQSPGATRHSKLTGSIPTDGASPTHGVRVRPAHGGHRIEYVAREQCLGRSPAGVLARRPSPIIAVYRTNAFSTRACCG